METEIRGKTIREHHPNKRTGTGDQGREFEYTASLFAYSVAGLLCGREAMDKWMETSQQALSGRTPAEALHLGKVQDVLRLLLHAMQ
ncbi:MAG: DUF2384 domain-containing protein [Alphaproteobacteria bacterium]|nr:DUF2384 domain-containing protein [Alphaproteobacteria bacterium]